MEQVMSQQAEKFEDPARLPKAPAAPMYASPWLALFSHLKATLGQRSGR